MKDVFKTYRPEGFSSVNTYLFVSDPPRLIAFLEKAFYAEIIKTSMMPDGRIGNCILKLGDTCIMISQARDVFQEMKTALYLYVSDVDEVYKNALVHGAEEFFAPTEMDYQDYQGGVIDPEGNYWWISKRLVEDQY